MVVCQCHKLCELCARIQQTASLTFQTSDGSAIRPVIQVGVAGPSAAVAEGSPARFTFSLSASSAQAVSVSYATVDFSVPPERTINQRPIPWFSPSVRSARRWMWLSTQTLLSRQRPKRSRSGSCRWWARASTLPRSSQRFEAKPRTDEAPLVKRMLQLVRARPRYGYRRIGWLLREEGWRAGLSRVFRLWQREGLKVPCKEAEKATNRDERKRLPSASGRVPERRLALGLRLRPDGERQPAEVAVGRR